MKNWHFIAGLISVLVLAFGQTVLDYFVAWEDARMNLPLLPNNPFAKAKYIADAAKELALVSVIAHTALMWQGANEWTKAIAVFVGLSAWNQFVDSAIGEYTVATWGEMLFFGITLVASILTFIKWRKKRLSK